MGYQRVLDNLIISLQTHAIVLYQVQNELGEIMAEHLTGVGGDIGRDIGWPKNCHSTANDALVSDCHFTIAAAFGCEVHDDASGAHVVDCFGCH